MPRVNQRFFASTRGRIVTLLRRSSRTVDELAQALALTDNAVRSHLATLERDGLVRQRGERRGGAKPAYVYELAPDAEQLFPTPYAQVLLHLIDALSEKMSAQEREDLLRAAGRRLAALHSFPGGDERVRIERAIEVFDELGGLAEVQEESDESYAIYGLRCPFAALVTRHPELCQLAEALLRELVGAPVEQRCNWTDLPQCFFTVQKPGVEVSG